MNRLVFCFLTSVGLLFNGTARADYLLPEFSSIIMTLDIVDAEVTEITKDGYAVLKVLEPIRGSAAVTTIKHVRWTCTPAATPRDMGVAAGKRYIFFLEGDALYEETSFIEVTTQPDGSSQCKIHEGHREWMKLPESAGSKEEFVSFLRKLQ